MLFTNTCISSSTFRLRHSYYYLFLTHLQMPKYAVAVGRKVGIYDTYNECKVQVNNYPNARFKKFNTEAEAAEFIRKETAVFQSKFSGAEDSILSNIPLTKENISKPNMFKVEKISPSNTTLNSLNNKISSLEQTLNNFIANVTELIEGLSNRIAKIEGSLKRSAYTENVLAAGSDLLCIHSGDEPPKKKQKAQDKKDIGNFLYTDNGSVKIYTDGACSKNGKMGAMAGIGVWFNENHPLNVSAPVKGPPTNNTAEIQAARVAITQAYRAGVKNITIYTDSQFLINCITQWIYKWKKNEWKLSSGGPVKNKEELVKLDAAIQTVGVVEWIHVAGHRGIKGNEMADSLAREGAAQYKTNVTYSLNEDD